MKDINENREIRLFALEGPGGVMLKTLDYRDIAEVVLDRMRDADVDSLSPTEAELFNYDCDRLRNHLYKDGELTKFDCEAMNEIVARNADVTGLRVYEDALKVPMRVRRDLSRDHAEATSFVMANVPWDDLYAEYAERFGGFPGLHCGIADAAMAFQEAFDQLKLTQVCDDDDWLDCVEAFGEHGVREVFAAPGTPYRTTAIRFISEFLKTEKKQGEGVTP